MQKSPWSVEKNRAIILILVFFCIGVITDFWFMSFALSITGFIVFYALNLQQIYQWLKAGAKNHQTPYIEGVLGSIVKQIYQNNKKSSQINNYLTDLIFRFDSTLEALPDATIIIDNHNKIEWANQAANNLLGISNKIHTGITIYHFLKTKDFTNFLTKKDRQTIDFTSPTDKNIRLSVTSVDYAKDKKLLIVNNISRHHTAQVSRKNFVANVSHELRTPLTVISGYLDILNGDDTLPSYMSRSINESLTQVSYMQSMIDELLKLSLIESNKLDRSKLEVIFLKPHINEVLSALKTSGKLGNRTINTNVDENLCISVIKNELDGVCYNLIGNAAKYSEDNSTIIISWEEKRSGYVGFHVEDEGLGISPQHLNRITERFYRVDKARSRTIGGTGLGLSIVKHILEKHKGYLEISSTENIGSIFSAYFPIEP